MRCFHPAAGAKRPPIGLLALRTDRWHVHCLVDGISTNAMRVVKRADIMDTRVPDFHQHAGALGASAAPDAQSQRDDESRAQEAALERLADRVYAARSIV
jgi:hypothetical protein